MSAKATVDDTSTITDESTAKAALSKARDDLARAVADATTTMTTLRATILRVRPTGILTVDEMADAIDRDRNYIDSVWSTHGATTKGKQTRVSADVSDEQRERTRLDLSAVAGAQLAAGRTVNVTRSERDRIVAMVYASKILGPSSIAAAVGIDRNHVLRIARKSRVAPAWRPAGSARNQHTAD